MDGFQANHAGNVPVTHNNRLAQCHTAVNAAHKVKLQIAFLGDMGDDKPYLVHMRCQQQFISGGLLALLEYDQIAQRIGTDAVGKGLGLGADIFPHPSFISGGAGNGTQLKQSLHHTVQSPSLKSSTKAASSFAVSSKSLRLQTSRGVCI